MEHRIRNIGTICFTICLFSPDLDGYSAPKRQAKIKPDALFKNHQTCGKTVIDSSHHIDHCFGFWVCFTHQPTRRNTVGSFEKGPYRNLLFLTHRIQLWCAHVAASGAEKENQLCCSCAPHLPSTREIGFFGPCGWFYAVTP